MGITLGNGDGGEFDIELPMEVILKCKDVGSDVAMLINARARAALIDDPRMDSDDPEMYLATLEHERMLQTGMEVVKSWEGVDDPCTPENVRKLLAQSPFGESFADWYRLRRYERVAAKNGFVPSSNGR